MSRLYYEMHNQYTNNYDVEKIYTLLLEIIDNKNNEEFDIFYTNYMSKFNPSYIGNINFNSFDNVNDFIDKACSVIQDINFYKELNTFLTEILKKHQKIKIE